jgi:hypothetical protein
MKKLLLAAVSVVTLLAATPAQAADVSGHATGTRTYGRALSEQPQDNTETASLTGYAVFRDDAGATQYAGSLNLDYNLSGLYSQNQINSSGTGFISGTGLGFTIARTPCYVTHTSSGPNDHVDVHCDTVINTPFGPITVDLCIGLGAYIQGLPIPPNAWYAYLYHCVN